MFPIETVSFDSLPPSLQREASRLIDSAETRDDPVFIHLLGIPAAGKSSFARTLHKILQTSAPVLIAFDRIMEAMPEYWVDAKIDAEKAFSLYELPARAAGYVVLKKLIEKKADILLDHSGSRHDHVEMLKYAKEKGYRVWVIRITAPNGIAKARIGKREAIEGRHTPLNYVDEREGVIASLVPAYQTIADFYSEIANDAQSANFEARFSEVGLAFLEAVKGQKAASK